MAVKKTIQQLETPAALRRRAQRQLKENPPAIDPTSDELSKTRLLHEIQVQKIELKIQNEELLRGKAEAEFHLQKYTALYDAAPVGYFTLSADGLIKQSNLTGACLLGVDRSQLIGKQFMAEVAEVLQPSFQDFLQQVLASPVQRSADFALKAHDKPPRPINIKAKRLINGSDCHLVVADITERKRTETALLHSKTMLATLIAQAPIGVFVVGPTFCIQQINPTALPVFRLAQPLISRDFAEVMHQVWSKPKAAPIIEAILARFRHTLKTGEPYRSPDLAHRRCQDHIKSIYEWQIQRICLPGNELGVVCFFSDVTHRIRAQQAMQRLDLVTAANKKLQKEIVHRQAVEKALTTSEALAKKLLRDSRQLQTKLRQLTHSTIRMHEIQRKQISSELHDGVGQLLMGINVQLVAFTKQAELDPKSITKSLALIHKMVTQSVHALHQFARELRPAMLDELGLASALRAYIEDISNRKGQHIEFTTTGNLDELDTDRRTVLYRVAQESIVNVLRHAKASHLQVTLSRARGRAYLTVADNGNAFDVKNLSSTAWTSRVGISTMRERVEMFGGRFTVTSKTGVGTTIKAVLPLS